ncbi:MAG: PEP-CTERM sorting domain-containing protein [Phycisphaerae bacterium]|nr:PEP-CTERM sorting domain-containing protein [Phycisphaerae bacterium]
MKKLLVLVLVLAVASLANATFVLELTAPDTVSIVGYDNLANEGAAYFVSVMGSADGGTIVGASSHSLSMITDYTGADVDLTAGIEYYAGGTVSGIYFAEIGDLNATNPLLSVPQNGILESWVGAAGTTITLHDNTTLESIAAITIPEPATMALLSLGGLLLRRKK